MPTITLSTPPLPVSRRRAIALRVTRWLTGHGIEPAHVVVRFESPDEVTVFSGGLPIEALPHDGTGPQHASVTCCVGPDRDEEFRAGLARCIADALGADSRTPFLYLEFRPTDPALVYLGGPEGLRRADQTAATATPTP